MDTIRYQQSELKKYTHILSMLISNDEVQKIDRMSVWDDDRMEYKIPYFYLRDRAVVYPKLNPQQAEEFIANEKSKKELIFKDSIDYRMSSDGEAFK